MKLFFTKIQRQSICFKPVGNYDYF